MSDARFARCFFVVAAVHVAVVVGIVVLPDVWRLFRKPRPLIVPVEFLVEVPGSPEPPGPEVKPKPEPTPPKPKPEPPKPKPAEAVKPAPPEPDAISTKPKPQKVKVEPSTKKVTRTVTRYSPKPTPSKLTAEEIEKLLAMGPKPSDRKQIPDEDSRGLDIIRRTLYAAWTQPAMPAAANPLAEVELVLDGSGVIRSWRILSGSGSAEFDASVRAALGQVTRIEGLTPTFLRRFSRVTVEFKLE